MAAAELSANHGIETVLNKLNGIFSLKGELTTVLLLRRSMFFHHSLLRHPVVTMMGGRPIQ